MCSVTALFPSSKQACTVASTAIWVAHRAIPDNNHKGVCGLTLPGAVAPFRQPAADGGADLWEMSYKDIQHMTDGSHIARATFSGGCFWCLQPPFDVLDGVVATVVGYAGGCKTDPV